MGRLRIHSAGRGPPRHSREIRQVRSRSSNPPLACGLAPMRRCPGRLFGDFSHRGAIFVEQFVRPVASHPGFELRQMLGVWCQVCRAAPDGRARCPRRACRPPFWAGPAFWRAQYHHRPGRPLWCIGCRARCLDPGDASMHASMAAAMVVHRRGIVPCHEIRAPSHSREKARPIPLRGSAPARSGRRSLAVEMQDRQHGAVAHRIEKFVGVPARGQRAGLRLAVADHAGRDQIRDCRTPRR